MAHVRTDRASRGAPLVALAALGLLALDIWRLTSLSAREVLRSDYLIFHTAGTVVRKGLGSQLYVDQVQGSVYSSFAAGDHTGDLLFNHAPLSAVLSVPFSMLAPATGHLVWSLAQYALVVLACALVARAAPWPAGTPRTTVVAIVLLALAGAGTLPLLLQGQGVGEIALGIGGAYWLWRRDRWFVGGAVLIFSAAVDKPHLAIGLIAFILGMRNRRVLLGALTGGAMALALSIAAVGVWGVIGFVDATFRSLTLYPAGGQDGLTGLFSSLLGAGPVAYGASAVCIALALGGCAWLGGAVRRQARLEIALMTAAALSPLAAPHLLAPDLAMLAPAFVAAGAGATRDDWELVQSHRRRALGELWVVLLVASGVETIVPGVVRLTPLALLVIVWYGARWMRSPIRSAVHVRRTSPYHDGVGGNVDTTSRPARRPRSRRAARAQLQ